MTRSATDSTVTAKGMRDERACFGWPDSIGQVLTEAELHNIGIVGPTEDGGDEQDGDPFKGFHTDL